MMSNKGRTYKNLTGGYNHYDGHGHKTGYSQPNLLGGYNHYDAKGHKTGESYQNLTGGYSHYDEKGHKTGSTQPNLLGGYNHYDSKFNKKGDSYRNLTGGYSTNSSSQGCYIATCVYGSYDCPEVWILRRFRDSYLRKRKWGRAFIKVYYRISPWVVRKAGGRIRKNGKWILDRWTAHLLEKGYPDTPYEDNENSAPKATVSGLYTSVQLLAVITMIKDR